MDCDRIVRVLRRLACASVLWVIGLAVLAPRLGAGSGPSLPGPRFEITFDQSAHAQPITGRVYVAITRDTEA